MKKTTKLRTTMFIMYTIIVCFAAVGAFNSNDLSLLTPDNSIYIENDSFEPSLSLNRI